MLLFFLAIGAGIFLFGLAGTVGPYKDSVRGNNDPRSLLGFMVFGAVFVLVALRMLQIALTGVRREGRGRRGQKRQRAWESDHPWRPEGQGPDYVGNTGGSILGLAGFLGLLGLFNVVFLSPSPWLLRGIVLLFDALGLVFVVDALRKAWQAMRHGRPLMRWTTFPAFTGDRLEGVFAIRPALRPNGPVRATLRCIRDEEGSQSQEPAGLEPLVVYRQIRELDAGGDLLRELPLSFDLPKDLPGTDLSRAHAIYWQVALQVPVTGPNYETVFLAPVYKREGG